jgi:hypothetical protein
VRKLDGDVDLESGRGNHLVHRVLDREAYWLEDDDLGCYAVLEQDTA